MVYDVEICHLICVLWDMVRRSVTLVRWTPGNVNVTQRAYTSAIVKLQESRQESELHWLVTKGYFPLPVHFCTLSCNFPISKITQIPTFTFVEYGLRISVFALVISLWRGEPSFPFSLCSPSSHTHMKSCSTSCKERRMKTKKACALFR